MKSFEEKETEEKFYGTAFGNLAWFYEDGIPSFLEPDNIDDRVV